MEEIRPSLSFSKSMCSDSQLCLRSATLGICFGTSQVENREIFNNQLLFVSVEYSLITYQMRVRARHHATHLELQMK